MKLDKPFRVVIVDDAMISRGYMELFIRPAKQYQVAASLPFARDAVSWCISHDPPDLILMDVMMAEGPDGLTAAAEIKKRHPQTKIIITTSMADADWLDRAKVAQVDSFWFKNYPDCPLLEIMDRTMAGESVYPGGAPALSLGTLPATALTKQQRALLRHVTQGLNNREIAEKMRLSPNTVKDYLDDLMEKTGIHSRTALAAQVSRLGLAVSGDEDAQQKI